MNNYTFYLTDAFTNTPLQGNPAGVVLSDDHLKTEDMQKIAEELKQSETAFIKRLDKDIYEVRFFTPVEEVDLCGHATIATFWVKGAKGYIESIENGRKIIIQHTKAGALPVYLDYRNNELQKVTMEQPEVQYFGNCKNIDKLVQALGIKQEDIGIEGCELPLEYVSTGIKDLMIPVKSKEILNNIQPNFALMEELSKEENFYSYHVFTGEFPLLEVYQRNFCPILGIDEESATGTSTGALLAYLDKAGVLKKKSIVANQGIEMGRPSVIYASIEEIDGKEKILVGGQATTFIEGVLTYNGKETL